MTERARLHRYYGITDIEGLSVGEFLRLLDRIADMAEWESGQVNNELRVRRIREAKEG